jgi:hypothetical protein
VRDVMRRSPWSIMYLCRPQWFLALDHLRRRRCVILARTARTLAVTPRRARIEHGGREQDRSIHDDDDRVCDRDGRVERAGLSEDEAEVVEHAARSVDGHERERDSAHTPHAVDLDVLWPATHGKIGED